jgi:hypothetical protein
VDNLSGEIFGRCQHPIVEGSGTGNYEGVGGQLFFKDDVESGTFPTGVTYGIKGSLEP